MSERKSRTVTISLGREDEAMVAEMREECVNLSRFARTAVRRLWAERRGRRAEDGGCPTQAQR